MLQLCWHILLGLWAPRAILQPILGVAGPESEEGDAEGFQWHVVGGALRNRSPKAIPLENGPDRRRAPGRPCLSGMSWGGPYETAILGQFR